MDLGALESREEMELCRAYWYVVLRSNTRIASVRNKVFDQQNANQLEGLLLVRGLADVTQHNRQPSNYKKKVG